MKILDALLVLKEEAVEGCIAKPRYGICCNLYEITGETKTSYDFVRDNCKDWENFSSNPVYPIDNYDDGCLWEGKQLELRLSLLDHLITKAKDLEV